jgi:hypothetical protein
MIDDLIAGFEIIELLIDSASVIFQCISCLLISPQYINS